jgi:hydroxypyruvate isomerase
MTTDRPISDSTARRYSANLSTLLAGVPLHARPGAAAASGYRFVESWWPFDDPAPAGAEISEFCDRIEEAGLKLTCLNLDAGSVARGERGLLSNPDHEARVRANLDAVAEIVQRTGCTAVNALYGNRVARLDPVVQQQVALRQLAHVVDTLAPLGVHVVIETLNSIDSPDYPLTRIDDSADLVAAIRDRSGSGSVGLLLDVYHLAAMRTDPVAAIGTYAAMLHHVQFADHPGRGRPGSGQIDFGAVERALSAVGYSGYVGLEFLPASSDPRVIDCELLRAQLAGSANVAPSTVSPSSTQIRSEHDAPGFL